MNIKEWFEQAEKERFSIPSLNYSDIWDFRAIAKTAVEKKAPVLIAANPMVVDEFGIPVLGAMANAILADYPMVFHHLDHCTSVEICCQAVNAGFKSVMIDGAALPLEENIALTKEVVAYAHPRGVIVEGELGHIGSGGVEGGHGGEGALFTDVKEAEIFVRETNVDILAVAVGSVHGFYKGKPELKFDLLQKLDEAVDVPLVLHGGTGIPDEDVRRAIELGIRKLNVGTAIHTTYMNCLRQELIDQGENPYTLEIMNAIQPQIMTVCSQWIDLMGAAGRC